MKTAKTLHFHQDQGKQVLAVILNIFFIGGCVLFAITAPDVSDRILGWLGCALSGGVIFITLRHGLTQYDVGLMFDSKGITCYRPNIGTIPWKEVQSFYIERMYHKPILCFQFHHPEIFIRRLSKGTQTLADIGRVMGYGDLAISFYQFVESIDEAVAYLEALGIREMSE